MGQVTFFYLKKNNRYLNTSRAIPRNMKTTTFLLLIICMFSFPANAGTWQTTITHTATPVTIDGKLDDAAWTSVTPITEMWEHYPTDTVRASKQTDIYLAYDENYLYIAALCYDTREKLIVQSLSRDDNGAFWVSDAFSATIDPLNSGRNGYFFGLNAGGGEIDALASQSGYYPQFDNEWSNKWMSAVGRSPEGYIYEMAIPFSIMSIDPNNKVWGINFLRNDMEFKNAYYTWTKYDISHDGRDLGYLGQMVFDSVPNGGKGKINIIPSITGGVKKDYEEENNPGYDFIYGLDAKIALSPRTNLDLMVVPDFSQANVDREYLNFGRFEYYMQEQRQFFLESSDLFTNFGADNFKPIYTRRIGIKDWNNYRIWGGGRLTGSRGESLRYGLLNVQTDRYEQDPAENFTIGVFEKNVGKSTLKGLITNIEKFDTSGYLSKRFNRTAGIDYQYKYSEGRFMSYGSANKSFTSENADDSYYMQAGTDYNGRQLHSFNKINYVADNYINDLGFFSRMYLEEPERDTTIRRGIVEVKNWTELYIYPRAESKLSYYSPYLQHESYFDIQGELEERVLGTGIRANHKNTGFTSLYYWHSDVYLPYQAKVNDDIIMPIEHYAAHGIGFFHKTDERKVVKHEFNIKLSEYYRGSKLEYYNSLTLRLMPYAKITADYTYCLLEFPEPWGRYVYHLAGFQTDVFLSRDLIWTTLLQLNTQNERFKLNSRFQWRYSPMSSFYIVLAENFDQSTGDPQNISLTAKLTYWLSR